MIRFLSRTRYLILIPILGLTLAVAFSFIFGGVGLITLLYKLTIEGLGLIHPPVETEQGVIIFEVVEYVHTFLVGTVLYITVMGLFQLFIRELDLPYWLKIGSSS